MGLKRIVAFAGFILIQFSYALVNAQSNNFPIPVGNPNQLFYLQRTPNTNTIICELNVKNGKVDVDDPVHVFWIRYQEKGQKEELSFIQRTFAYGMKVRKTAENQYEMHFVSYKKQKLYLQLSADKQYHVFAAINQKMAILSKIYLHINGGTFWSPNVEYIELTGTDPITHQVVVERKKV